MKKNLIILAVISLCGLVYGAGYQLYSESASEALGVGGAVVGFQGNISNAWYNQASLTSFDHAAMMFGLTSLKLGFGYEYKNGHDELKDDWRPTAFGYGVMPINDRLVLGFSGNAPYGMITEWDNDWTESYMTTYTNIRAVYFTPSLAWKITDELSIGVGINLVSAMARMARNMPSPDNRRNKIYMRADDPLSFGGAISVHYQPSAAWGFGLQYQSRVHVNLKGDAEYRYPLDLGKGNVYRPCDVKTSLTLPSSLALGLSNTSFKNLRLGASVVWTEWSNYDMQKINFDSLPGTVGVRGFSKHDKKWDDTFSFRLGAEYYLNEHWLVRCGYMYDICQDNDKYRSPEIPDSDRHMYSIGLGYRGDCWGVDLTYGYLRFSEVRIGTHSGSVANGKFVDADVHMLSFAITREF